ncbi:MAG: PEP/pyruvate-binding domain-containing protein [Candidatus Levybacteria bacterium]|nr:PEP/pyruvate-binding domain-containing protein [Candidatus Levybacteria bacterium]
MVYNSRLIIDFSELYKIDADFLGKKAHLISELKELNMPVPDGFIITPLFLKKFLSETGIHKEIKKIQEINHPSIKDSMHQLYKHIAKKIIYSDFPPRLASELHKSYRKLSGLFKEQSLNIFTSPLSGKFLQFSDIKGDANLLHKLKEIWATQIENPTNIVIQKNIKSKIKGKISTDDFSIDKNDLLTENQIAELVRLARKVKKHFYFPQIISFEITKSRIFITDILPVTKIIEIVRQNKPAQEAMQQKVIKKVLIKGIAVNPGIATGSVRILRNQDYYQVKKGEIAVIPQLNKLLYSKVAKAKAIIADAELLTDNDKMIYKRNIKVPTIMGTKDAIRILQNGNIITVNGISGEIYQGGLI